jgi:hypothetical protein
MVVRAADPADASAIVAFFAKYDGHFRMCTLGFEALSVSNFRAFGPLPVMPDTSKPADAASYSERWDCLVSLARTGDLIFTRSTTSRQSALIASMDDGSWSHVVYFVHDGWVSETTPGRGTALVRIETLRDLETRVGLYRPCEWLTDKTTIPGGMRKLVAMRGRGYNYIGAIMAGLRARFLRERSTTPNGLIYDGTVYPVAIV